MNQRLTRIVGLFATAMFLGLGGLMLSEQRTGLGAVFLALGVARGGWLARDLFGGESAS